MTILSKNQAVKNRMPEGVWALFFIQIVSTLSYSVLYSTLVLFMRGKLGLPGYLANSIMGVFVAFNYALHLLGGYWGGRIASYRALFCLGMIAQVIGCYLLSLTRPEYLYYALGTFLTGSGLNVTCLNCMLTQRFTPEDSRRESAFLWNYAGMNVGFFIGFTLSGYYQLTENYQTLFLLSSLGNILALILCLVRWRHLNDKDTLFLQKKVLDQKRTSMLALGLVCLMPFALSELLQHADWSNRMVLVTGVAMLVVVCYIANKQTSVDAKNKLYAFAILMTVGVIFWMLYQIGPMGLTNFINNNVQRNIDTWTIPPQWFQNINTLAIVVGGPLLAIVLAKMRNKGIAVNIPTQFAMALLFIGVAFIILPIGILNANAEGLINPTWIVACFILQSIGELLISPIGYAMIGALVPAPLQGIMMGVWMLSSGVGATLSSYSSNWMTAGEESVIPTLTNPGYSAVFLALGLFAIAASAVLYLLIPKLKQLMQKNSADTSEIILESCQE